MVVFAKELQRLGWIEGRNLRVDSRWSAGNPVDIQKSATEFAALDLDAILTSGTATMGIILQVVRSVPIVFVNVADPVGAGYVESLARPGGNATGFVQFEYGISGKWLELLKEAAPSTTRVAVIRDPAISSGLGQWGAIQSAAPSVGLEVVPVNVRDPAEIERGLATFSRLPNGGLIVTGSALAAHHRNLLVQLASKYRLPAIYYRRVDGGLISYGPDGLDQYRQAAGYVDRVLKGEKPADLPVQAPTKFELVINLKTAKALGLDSPADAARPRRRGDRMKTARVHHAARRRGGAWPLAARAQQPERMRRIGVLVPYAENDPEAKARFAAFLQGLQQSGWTDGGNVRIDARWTAGSADDTRKHAAELAASAPDVILTHGSSTVGPLLQVTRAVPIVFVVVPEPVGAGFVESLARPGGNATGFITYEFGMSAKWLELLKQIAPGVMRAAVIRDPATSTGVGMFGAIQSVAPLVGVQASPVGVHDAGEIERVITAFARTPNGGLIVTGSALTALHRDLIITLADRYNLPAIYYERSFVKGGGLISYGPDFRDQYRRAASYVDRILKGEKPADLPVQAPTKYELSSISRPPRRSASTCRRRCSPAPTR